MADSRRSTDELLVSVDSRIFVSHASVGYRGDETAGGRTIKVAGEIRDDADYVLRIEELRARQDDDASIR